MSNVYKQKITELLGLLTVEQLRYIYILVKKFANKG